MLKLNVVHFIILQKYCHDSAYDNGKALFALFVFHKHKSQNKKLNDHSYSHYKKWNYKFMNAHPQEYIKEHYMQPKV